MYIKYEEMSYSIELFYFFSSTFIKETRNICQEYKKQDKFYYCLILYLLAQKKSKEKKVTFFETCDFVYRLIFGSFTLTLWIKLLDP